MSPDDAPRGSALVRPASCHSPGGAWIRGSLGPFLGRRLLFPPEAAASPPSSSGPAAAPGLPSRGPTRCCRPLRAPRAALSRRDRRTLTRGDGGRRSSPRPLGWLPPPRSVLAPSSPGASGLGLPSPRGSLRPSVTQQLESAWPRGRALCGGGRGGPDGPQSRPARRAEPERLCCPSPLAEAPRPQPPSRVLCPLRRRCWPVDTGGTWEREEGDSGCGGSSSDVGQGLREQRLRF